MLREGGIGLIAHAQIQGDPTHTLTLRRAYSAQMTKRFRALKGVIRKSLIENDALALRNQQQNQSRPMTQAAPKGKGAEEIKGQFSPIPARRFDFRRSSDKIEGFMEWLNEQQRQGVLEVTQGQQVGRALEDHWQNQYIRSSYQKGILRARQEMQNAGYSVPDVDDVEGGLNGVFNQPFHADRVGSIYTRAFEELKGITAAMDQQISRELAEGLARGDGPEAMARRINNRVDKVGLSRARVLARTETIRSHHSATVQEYRNFDVEGVKVKAEWSTAGDSRVCELCAPLEGQEYELDVIEGMIPRHPQCRCVALPLDRTEVEEMTDDGDVAGVSGSSEATPLKDIPNRATGDAYSVSPDDLNIEVYSDDVVNQYVEKIQAGEEFAPVFLNKNDLSHIVDGNHRAAAFDRLNMNVPATPVERADVMRALGVEEISPQEYWDRIKNV